MKKLVLTVLVLVLLITSSMSAFAFSLTCPECDDGSLYKKTIRATCISDGYETYECTKCSFSSYIRTLRSLGHNKPSGVLCRVDASCTRCNKNMGWGSKHGYKTTIDEDTGIMRVFCWLCGEDK